MMASSASFNKIERAHQMYRDRLYDDALQFYTQALAMASTNPQKIALHSNRAACYLKLHHFLKAAEECTSVLELDHVHTGALMLRAQTLVTLKEYNSALFDVNRLIELNPSSEVYQNLHARLRTQVSLAPIPESEEELEEEEEDRDVPKPNRNYAETYDEGKNYAFVEDEKSEPCNLESNAELIPSSTETAKGTATVVVTTTQTQISKESSESRVNGWKTIPKPKGHSTLDYARWDRVENDSSEDDDDDDDDEEESQPQYRFRVRTVGVRPVK